MSALLLAAAAAGLLAAGYVLGRLRPLDRLDTWVWEQLTFASSWATGSRLRQVVLLTAHALVQPAMTWDAWRRRNEPLPGRAPALEFNPRWGERHDAPTPPTTGSDDGEDRPA